jgi:hypothetical protein
VRHLIAIDVGRDLFEDLAAPAATSARTMLRA